MQIPIQLSWQQQLAHAIRDVDTLCSHLNIDRDALAFPAQNDFSCLVPQSFMGRIESGNPADPLLLQVLPQSQEMQPSDGFVTDPLQEQQHNPIPGLLHKYPSRVLLTLAGGCAVNCRYCFRRHFPYAKNIAGQSQWVHWLDYIRSNPDVNEVIFSGGDPLLMKDEQMTVLVKQLESLPQLTRLRIHTRLPIVIPDRVTDQWVDWMRATRLNVVVVLHCNHPNEIDTTVKNALQRLQTANITLLNQSVLLKNINDDADVLARLSERLFAVGVLPYYLHLLDKVQGAAHFDVSIARANEIMLTLKKTLPGFLVPKLAQEIAGMQSKQY